MIRGGELTLRDSKLFRCATGAVVEFFNDKFGTNLPALDVNGVDIFSIHNKQELLRQLNEPCELCSFCNLPELTTYYWEKSSYDIAEWASI